MASYDSKAGIRNTTGNKSGGELRGDISFEQMMQASDNSVHMARDVTIFHRDSNGNVHTLSSRKKKDLQRMLESQNITDVVMSTRRDKAGQNDIQRMQDLGFTIQAQTKGVQSGTTPPMDYYYMKKTGMAKQSNDAPASRQKKASAKQSRPDGYEGTTREQRRTARVSKQITRAAKKGRPEGSK